jgi:hypothetical protein
MIQAFIESVRPGTSGIIKCEARVRTAVLGIVICHLLSQGAWTQPPDIRFAHPNAGLLAGVNMERVVHSEMTRTLLTQIAARQRMTVGEIERLIAVLGKINQIWISAPAGSGTPDWVALVTGRLDDPALAAMLEHHGPFQNRVIDANSVLIGSELSLEQALRRMSSGSPVQTQIQRHGIQLAKRNDLWFTGAPSLLAGGLFPVSQTVLLQNGVRGMSFGLSLGNPIGMNFAMELSSPDAASRMLAAYTKQQQDALSSGPPMHVEAQGAALHFSMAVNQHQALEELAGVGLGDKIGSQLGPFIAMIRAQSAGGQPAAKAAAPVRKTILIHGLSEGPAEIPLAQP